MENIETAIDHYLYDRFRNWRRTEEGLTIQWNPDDAQSWVPIKDWKEHPHTMSKSQLITFASYFYNLGLKSASQESPKEPERKPDVFGNFFTPYSARPHKNSPSKEDPVVLLSAVVKHYQKEGAINLSTHKLKKILCARNFPVGFFGHDKKDGYRIRVRHLDIVHHIINNDKTFNPFIQTP